MTDREENTSAFPSGAVRSTDAADVRYDLISPIGLRRLAARYALGAKNHGDHNWEKGLPASDTLNHALNHINLWLAGDATDDNLAAAAWGLFALMHFEEVMPEMIDVPSRSGAATSATSGPSDPS